MLCRNSECPVHLAVINYSNGSAFMEAALYVLYVCAGMKRISPSAQVYGQRLNCCSELEKHSGECDSRDINQDFRLTCRGAVLITQCRQTRDGTDVDDSSDSDDSL